MSLHISASKEQIAKTVLMPGDPLRAKFIAENFLTEPVLYNQVRGMFGYTGTYKGVPVSIQGSGMGMPSMGIYSWELFNDYDVENIIRIGTAGSFSDKIDIGDIVVSMATSTDSNYSHAFKVPGQYSPCASFELLEKVMESSKEVNVPIKAGNTVTCDVFYEPGDDWWKSWQRMGVLAVEMEAAALYMNAAYSKRNALAMMTISDHFVTGARSTQEERETQFTDMMKLALNAAVR
ncbi:MAG: purine-nucleoside phosphorylase [Peptostreptococcaceae bacterium]|nr:purine-nucleoside phosphorylase [Peptostreptococcaceae bacterium]MDY5738526.1 purine-nucleoside phosphorylase [Anaerovoracaceae bacterium]